MAPSIGGGEVLQLMSIFDPPFCVETESVHPLLPAMACELDGDSELRDGPSTVHVKSTL